MMCWRASWRPDTRSVMMQAYSNAPVHLKGLLCNALACVKDELCLLCKGVHLNRKEFISVGRAAHSQHAAQPKSQAPRWYPWH